MYKNINFLTNLGNSKKPGLYKIKKVLSFFSNPHLRLKNCILISGTNGKGAVAQSLSNILTISGYRTGLYTSPHLVRINERLKINNKNITNRNLDLILDKIIQKCDKNKIQLSYFELITAAAILYFYKEKNDINIFEVGLGGRFDATNIVNSKMALITNIGKDHMNYLGHTIELIAKEKAGIIRKNGYLITSAEKKGLNILLKDSKRKRAKVLIRDKDFFMEESNSKYYYKSDSVTIEFKTNLLGEHQMSNLALSIKASEIINKEFGFRIKIKNIKKTLSRISLPGRLQLIERNPIKIIDTAHNVHAISNLVKNLKIFLKGRKINFLIGMLKDKRPRECINIIKEISNKIYVVNVPHARSFDANKLVQEFDDKNIKFIHYEDIPKIINYKRSLVITGSNYLIGHLLSKYVQLKKF